jgi:hypothetical protein
MGTPDRDGLDPHEGPTMAEPSHYGTQKIVAAIAVLILAAIAAVIPPLFARWRASGLATKLENADASTKDRLVAKHREAELRGQQPYFALLLGEDGRLSTSKTIAALWTLLVAYILLALIFVWPSDWSSALAKLWPTYVLFLGGPYAALVLAKAAVSTRVAGRTLQKAQVPGEVRLSDLVGDDSGSPDLFDSQYVLFNLIAMIFVIDAFIRATTSGFPSLPEGLVLLTGGPAAVYAANKVTSSNAPVIFSVRPSVVRPGDSFTIFGQNLAPGGTVGDGTTNAGTVEVGGYSAVVTSWTDTAIAATAPTPDTPCAGALDVGLTTVAGVQALLVSALTINQAPVLAGLSAGRAAPGSQVTASGLWTLSAGAAPTIRVDGLAAPVLDQPIPGSSVTFEVPSLAGQPSATVSVRVVVGALASNPATLEITG